MFHRTQEKYEYKTDNIIVGKAELPFITRNNLSGWAVPGGKLLTNHKSAVAYARRLNQVICNNLGKYGRKI